MPLQGSGSISISELATEFGGQAPHSLSEYYKSAGLVPSQRAITGSESYTSLVTGDQIASTGIYVNGNTDSKTTTDASFTGQTTSGNSGDLQYSIREGTNQSDTAEDVASSISIASGTYVNISMRFYMRYENTTVSGTALRYFNAFWGNGSSGNRRIGFDWVLNSANIDVSTDGVEVMHEFTQGQSSDFTVTNSNARDLSSIGYQSYTRNMSGDGWQARPTIDSGNQYFDVTIKGYATQATTIKIVAMTDYGSTHQASFLHGNGAMTGTDPDQNVPYTAVTFNSSLTMNQYKAYNTNSYALSVNGTSIPANTPSGSAVLFADNLLTTNVTASVTGNQPLNADVPTSGAISLTDFYSSEDE